MNANHGVLPDNAPEWAQFFVETGGREWFGRFGASGTRYLWENCGRCGGSGRMPYSAYSGVCFDCNGKRNKTTGSAGVWVKLDEVIRKAKRREADRKRREAKIEKAAAEAAAAIPGMWADLIAAHPLLVAMRDITDETHSIVVDMRAKFERYGSLSDRQIALAEKLIQEARPTKNAPQEDAEPVAVPLGKQVVTGKVVHIKESSNYFDPRGGLVLQWLVVTEEGWKVWGTVPGAVFNVEVNDQVTFTATLVPGWDDKDKSLVKAQRPSKAKILTSN